MRPRLGRGSPGNGLVLAGLAALCGCQFDVQSLDRFLLRPWPASPKTPADYGQTFEDVRITSSGGNQLSAWFVPAQNGRARATLLVHTGMEGNIARFLSAVVAVAERDFNVFIYDWQGFGASEGLPDFRNFEPDAFAAANYLRARPEPSCHRVIQMGISLGDLPAVAMAAQTPETIGLVVYGPFFPEQLPSIWILERTGPLLVPFANVAGVWWFNLLPGFMNPRNFIDQVRVPSLQVTPRDDTIVPPSMQRLFYDALPEPKELYLTYGGHTRSPENDPELFDAITDWCRRLPGLLPEEP